MEVVVAQGNLWDICRICVNPFINLDFK